MKLTRLSQNNSQQNPNNKCQNLSNPNQKFTKKDSRSCHANALQPNWYFLIRKCINQGSQREALVLYNQIRCKRTYILGLVPLILKACASVSMIKNGKCLHAEAVKNGVDFDVVIGTSLVDMYAKSGDINVVTWNAMIGGYVRNGDMKSASVLFEKMSSRTAVTWIEMIDGFARSGDLVTARCIFDQVPPQLKDVVTWTVMVDGYTSKGQMVDSRVLFEEMPERNFFAWSSMISGYCKIGHVKEARAIFDLVPIRNLVNWNSLICGYAQNRFCEEALKAFRKMQADGFEPDEVTVVSILSAIAQLGLLDVGKDVHQLVYDKGIKLNQFVMNASVDMYAKCDMYAKWMTSKNSACWNAMITGCAIHGQCKEALDFFRRMEKSIEKPDEITFLSVLSACAHGGFIEKRGLATSIMHYGCVRMPIKPNDAVWGALVGACRVHFDMDMVKRVMEDVNRQDRGVDSGNDPHYVLLSNIYVASDCWGKAERMRMLMVNQGLLKTPGRSSVMLVNTEE
ncbi:hypothetical protein P3X46_021456 [Hevea brasiliensis]|uniref:Pentacotripeptide-repeat region of PRORP domain-containing protein n=1 Tax=Hevea brasiliensis TaxID=3981 RepID=A0ABQ9LHQ8_HEVBR|nr:hypothetical protein P3X46_021456 [Hevea brasiliensis]